MPDEQEEFERYAQLDGRSLSSMGRLLIVQAMRTWETDEEGADACGSAT